MADFHANHFEGQLDDRRFYNPKKHYILLFKACF